MKSINVRTCLKLLLARLLAVECFSLHALRVVDALPGWPVTDWYFLLSFCVSPTQTTLEVSVVDRMQPQPPSLEAVRPFYRSVNQLSWQ